MKHEILKKTAELFGIAMDDLWKLKFCEVLPIKVRGKKYPEQSTRQDFRGFRRAQGGPGLDDSNYPRGYLDV